ncbi:hypothetical protein JXA88_16720, partial [Candidatus Fermentibacteria bacterium]|nr:hypothetical protein [Candidatus Fermentibacteria bacterium]
MVSTLWCVFGLMTMSLEAVVPPHPASGLAAVDVPDDKGGAVSLSWRIRPEDAARIRVQLVQKAVSPGEFVVVD